MEEIEPEVVTRVAQRLAKLPGVQGVFWGPRYRAGGWLDEEGLSVHVRSKRPAADLPESERLPAEIEGIPIDVIEVGEPKVTVLDMFDTARPGGSGTRPCSITALAPDGADFLALLCGHGTLPQPGNRILRSFEAGGGAAGTVDLHDGLRPFRAELMKGFLGGQPSVDYAVARLRGVPRDAVSTFHATAGSYPPFWVRSGPLRPGELLSYTSQRTKKPVHGKFRLRDVAGMSLGLPDGSTLEYTGVLAVDSIDVPFVEGGDSGALAVDQGSVMDGSQRRPAAVGVVLGQSGGAPHLGYVLSVRSLKLHLGSLYSLFFKEAP